MADAPQNSTVDEAPGEEAAAPARVRVLVADANTKTRALLAAALRDDGHEVIEVASGSELLDLLAEASRTNRLFDRPNVVVCDLRVPRCCGLDVLVSLKGANWAVPVILTSARVDHDMYRTARRLGAVAVFDDPFDLDDLRTLVMNVTRVSHARPDPAARRARACEPS
jgi:DNA-binding NtrC family response regulator